MTRILLTAGHVRRTRVTCITCIWTKSGLQCNNGFLIIKTPVLWENVRIQILSSQQRLLLVERVQCSLSFWTIIVPDQTRCYLGGWKWVVNPSSFSDWHSATADLFALFTGHLTFKPIFSQMEKYRPARSSFGDFCCCQSSEVLSDI